MKRILSVIMLTILLIGCNSVGKVKYQDVPTPVYVVPAPPTVVRPALAVDALTPEQRGDAGLVAQAQRATAVQKQGYIDQLELIIKKYGVLAAESQANLNKMLGLNAPTVPTLDSATEEEWKAKMAPKPVEQKP